MDVLWGVLRMNLPRVCAADGDVAMQPAWETWGGRKVSTGATRFLLEFCSVGRVVRSSDSACARANAHVTCSTFRTMCK